MDRVAVFALIEQERQRQDNKWGEQSHHPGMWMMILSEEVGEAAKAALEGNNEQWQTELIQVAAVAVAALEALVSVKPMGKAKMLS